MAKPKNNFKKKVLPSVPDKIVDQFSEEDLSYVLITCTKPNEHGNMDVEMNYEGDEVLISYLVTNAKEILENQENQLSDQESKRSCL